MQKTIIGRYSANNATPFNYTPPLEKMVSIFNYKSTDNFALVANEGIQNNDYTEIQIMELVDGVNNIELTGFDRIGFSAGFKTLLKEYDVIEGTYGIKIKVEYDNAISTLYFDNSEMYGDTYNFKSFFSQEQVFDISGISDSIKKITVFVFQKSNFKDVNGNFIDYNIEITDKTRTMLQNIFINNFELFLGYDSERFNTDTILLYCPDNDLTYGANIQSDVVSKKIIARWIHKNEEGIFIPLTVIEGNYELRWYQEDKNAESDGYSGKGWAQLESLTNAISIDFIPQITKQSETIKTVGIITDDLGEKTYYTGESITFINSKYKVSQEQASAQTAAQIHCKDGSEGNYFIYNQNSKLNNNGEGTAKKRQFEFLWQGQKPTIEMGLTEIRWLIPLENTMIYLAEEDYNKWNKKYIYLNGEKPYIEITKKLQYNEDKTKNNFEEIILQDYAIRNSWSPSRGNNHIRCVATIAGIEYEAIEDLNFGKAGTTGTDVTLALEFEGEVALTASPGETIAVAAYLYNSSGEIIPWTEDLKQAIVWSWKDEEDEEINRYMSMSAEGAIVNLIWPSEGAKEVPKDNYNILQCTLPWGEYDLISYLPIPIKMYKTDSYIEGATEILYDAAGTPHYDKNTYRLFEKTNAEKVNEGIEWIISAKEIDTYLPTLKKNDEGVALSANPLFVKGSSDKICVCCIDSGNNVIYWSQPILIMESQYGFSMLNSWDGTMQINEENGTILSTMLGAGKKNNDNTFTGVLIGDIEKGTGNQEIVNQIGVYGLQDGMITYALTEDGKATFGKANSAGQIIIDGDEGNIISGNYQSSNGQQGMNINLTNGHIDAYNFKLTSSKILIDSSEDADPYFRIKDSSYTESGERNFNTLINIGIDDYYLQSREYASTNGMKIDLKDGKIQVAKSLSGKVILQPSEPFFQVQDSSNNNLIYMGENNYYLQSSGYSGTGILTGSYNGTEYKVYKDGSNNVAVLNNAKNDVYTLTNMIIENGYVKSATHTYKTFSSQNITIDSVDENGNDTKVTITLTADEVKENYLAKLKPYLVSKEASGVKIDLSTGIIHGYDLYLKGTKKSEDKYFLLDSSSPSTPLRIGDNFSVSWDGALTCSSVTYLGTKPQADGNVMYINDHFYVNSSGAGGSFSGSHYGSGGFSSLRLKGKTLNASTVRLAEKLGLDLSEKTFSQTKNSLGYVTDVKFGGVSLSNRPSIGYVYTYTTNAAINYVSWS